MIGRKQVNPSRTLFIKGDHLIQKMGANVDQRMSQADDFVMGKIDDNTLVAWSKYNGNDKQDPANYEISDFIDPAQY